jgi:hypothetical protein
MVRSKKQVAKLNSIMNILLGLALLVGMFALPYIYYVFLRFGVFTVCLINLYVLFKYNEIGNRLGALAVIVLFFLLVLFNPFIPIHLSKTCWSYIDAICGAGFIGYGFHLWKYYRMQ